MNLLSLCKPVDAVLLARTEQLAKGCVQGRYRHEACLRRRIGEEYAESVARWQQCKVSFSAQDGLEHSVEVAAETLYEAAARAVAEFRKAELIEYPPGPGVQLRVEVRPPATTHIVPFEHVQSWLKKVSGSPKEIATKSDLQKLLERD